MVSDTENIAVSQWLQGIYLVKITEDGKELGTMKVVKK
ncbi:MAG: T9SS type A sorting domain-containing protein [Prevotellaceae bacterium]|nr:T9SS type A sorting domain-containing protein [Prevotellaceae bacterium]